MTDRQIRELRERDPADVVESVGGNVETFRQDSVDVGCGEAVEQKPLLHPGTLRIWRVGG